MTPARLAELREHVARGHSLPPAMALELLAEVDTVREAEAAREARVRSPAPCGGNECWQRMQFDARRIERLHAECDALRAQQIDAALAATKPEGT